MKNKPIVFDIAPGPEAAEDMKRIRRSKPKTWPDEEYEVSVETAKALKEIKDTYRVGSGGFSASCYCDSLICNDWGDIGEDMILRPCTFCAKIVKIALDYATDVKDFEYVKKRIFRFKRFNENFSKIKILVLIQKFGGLFRRDQKDSNK